MNECLKKIIAIFVLNSYSMMLLPANELKQIFRENYNFSENIVYEEKEELEQIVERIQNNELQSDDCFFYENGFVNNSSDILLIHKSNLYRELLEAKENFYFNKAGTKYKKATFDDVENVNSQWKEIVNAIIQNYLSSKKLENGEVQFIESEFYLMEKEIYNSLLNELLYDQYSLKKISDAESANVIVNALSNEVEDSTLKNVEKLFNQAINVNSNLTPDDIKVTSENWLSELNIQIEKGIDQWNEIEKDFLLMKLKWEESANNIYEQNLTIWNEAYRQLTSRREKWNLEIREKIQEGYKIFAQRESELLDEIENLENAFLLEQEEIINQKKEYLSMNQKMFVQSKEMIKLANENIQNWFSSWTSKYNGIYSYWKSEDNLSNENLLELTINISEIENLTYEQSLPILESYIEKLNSFLFISKKLNLSKDFEESVNVIISELSLLKKWMDIQIDYSKDEKKYLATINSILNETINLNNSSQNVLSQIIQFEQIEQYWKDEINTLNQINDYSQNNTSSIETLEQTKERYENTYSEYLIAKEEYSKSLNAVQEKYNNYKLAVNNYENEKIILEDKLSKFESLQKKVIYLKDGISISEINKIKENIIENVNTLNAIKFNTKDEEKNLFKYLETLLNEEYFTIKNNSQMVVSSLEGEYVYKDETNVDGTQVVEEVKIPSIEDLKKIIVEKESKNENAEYEKKLLENRLGIIQFILTGNIDETNPYILRDEMIQNYSNYSYEYRKKIDKEVLNEIALLIDEQEKIDSEYYKNFSDKDINDFFEKAESLIDKFNCSEFIRTAFELYKTQLINIREIYKKNYVSKNLSDSLEKNVVIKQPSSNLNIYKKMFLDLSYVDNDIVQPNEEASQNLYTLSNKIFSNYESFLKQIDFIEDGLLSFNEKKNFYDTYVNDILKLEDELKQAEQSYLDSLEKISMSSKNNLYSKMKNSFAEYEKVQSSSVNAYENLNQKKYDFEVAERLYSWAENQYLHLSYDSKDYDNLNEQLQYAISKSEETKRIIQLLKNFESREKLSVTTDENSKELFENLSSAEKQTLLSFILYNETEELLQNVNEEIFNVQNEKYSALFQIVNWDNSIFFDVDKLEIPKIIEKVVSIDLSQNDSSPVYTIKFDNEHDSNFDKELFFEYLNQNVIQYDISGNEIIIPRASLDAIEFLCSLESKPYSIEELMLASCFVKSKFNDSSVYFQGEDPANDANYNLDIGINDMFGMNFIDAYREGRINSVKNAYKKVMENDGLDDIAKFLFYSNFSINNNYDFEKIEVDKIAFDGLQNVISELSSAVSKNQRLLAGYTVAGVFLSAMVATFFGAWAAAPLAATLGLIASTNSAINSLKEVREDFYDIQAGYSKVLNKHNEEFSDGVSNYILYNDKENSLNEILNQIFYGKKNDEESADNLYSYINFENYLLNIFSDKYNLNEKNDFALMNIPGETNSSLEDLFNQAVDLNQCKDNVCAIEMINNFLADKKDLYFNQWVLNYNLLNEDCKNTDSLLNQLKIELLSKDSEKELDSEPIEKQLQNLSVGSYIKSENYLTNLLKIYKNSLYDVSIKYDFQNQAYVNSSFDKVLNVYEKILQSQSSINLNQKMNELNIFAQKFYNQFNKWQSDMDYVLKVADSEWIRAEEVLQNDFNRWNNDFIEKMYSHINEIDSEYENLLSEKSEWINNQYANASLSGIKKIENIPLEENCDFENKINKLIVQMNNEKSFTDFIPDEYFSTFLDDSLFSNISNYIFSKQSINDFALFDYCKNNRISNSEDIDKKIEYLIEYNDKKMRNFASVYSAQILQNDIDFKIAEVNNLIEQKNQQMEDWEFELVSKAGYSFGDEITRYAVIDSTVVDNAIREKQSVHKYEWFKSVCPNISSITKNIYNYDYDKVELLLEKSLNQINEWQIEILGNDGEGGKLKEHIGVAPEWVDNVDTSKERFKNISKNGSGEMGLIMLDFVWNSILNKEGYAALRTPLYDKKITTDNTFLGIEIPTIREISEMVCQCVSKATGQTWFSYFDDIVFGVADLNFGMKNLSEISIGLAQKISSSFINDKLGAITDKIGMDSISDRVLTSMINSASRYGESVVNSYIGAMDFSNGFSIDWDKANSVWTDSSVIKQSLSSGAVPLVEYLTNSALSNLTLRDGINHQLNSNLFNIDGINSINSNLSKLTSSLVEKKITGSTTLNFLSLNDFGFKLKNDIGLVGVTFSGDGVSSKFSTNGTMINASSMLQSLEGLSDFTKIASSKILNEIGFSKEMYFLNSVNALANTNLVSNVELANSIWHKDIDVDFVDTDEYLGKEENGKIYISQNILANTDESAVQVASLIAHENYHTKGNDEIKSRFFGYETYNSLANSYEIYTNEFSNVSDVAELSKVYLEEGEKALFSLLYVLGAFDEQGDGNFYRVYLTYAKDGQNTNVKLKDTPLGKSLTKEEVAKFNLESLKKSYGSYLQDEYKKYLNSCPDSECMDFETFSQSDLVEHKSLDDFESALENDMKQSKKNQVYSKYHYEKVKFYSIYSYGCKLASSVYMAYSLTNKYVSLEEANRIAIENGLFSSNGDAAGQMTMLNGIESQEKLINAIAGETLVEAVGSYDSTNMSKQERIELNEKILTGCDNSSEGYIIHGRVNGSHSVVVDNQYTTTTQIQDASLEKKEVIKGVKVQNPWRFGSHLNYGKDFYLLEEITRLDVFRVVKKNK